MINNKINCIILDDEPFAVKLMADYVSKVPQLNLLYADCDVFKAMDVLKTQAVDLVFLDIQMPQLTGIELMQLFNRQHNFIITSAYPQYALEAYQFHVIDFLLKPITFTRFYQSIEKYTRWQETFQLTGRDDSLFVKADRKHYKIAPSSILYIEGLKDYIRIHTTTEQIMVLENMKDIIEKLPTKQFVRIHRSYIIPLDKIRVIEGNQVQMVDGTYLPIGETYRKMVGEWIEKK
ncbi:LytTR family two component transcriptional regulator [Chitinophaga skermanii]|uniref:LytTR family two component transcriptional regulator n=1 Tax=Chitinophaga skermanii TaxID=331697 RepID=A0A327QWZ3_9BACT|nr:LytTR family DNA-binding domain-containing protein [Chitinophaga skermanii]RAJ08338.1 LytTR family two component transcriptional regulator [Chitinophaga skermanii]